MNEVGYGYVHDIRGLLVPRNASVKEIAANVDDYVSLIPALTEKLKSDLAKLSIMQPSDYLANLKVIYKMLMSVRAVCLQKEADTLFQLAAKEDFALCERKTQPFIANLLTLSIEMQTAVNSFGKNTHNKVKSIEFFQDILKNLSVVHQMIKDRELFDAADILSNMSVLDENDTAVELIKALNARNHASSNELMEKLLVKFEDEITKIEDIQKGANKKVLLVDDRPDILETVSGYLRDIYKVFALTGGPLALKLLEKQQPDIFILDIDMPDMDGITLARTIRQIPEHAKTPIMMLTSNATKDYVHSAMQAGANDFLVKPANRDMIRAKVSSYLS